MNDTTDKNETRPVQKLLHCAWVVFVFLELGLRWGLGLVLGCRVRVMVGVRVGVRVRVGAGLGLGLRSVEITYRDNTGSTLMSAGFALKTEKIQSDIKTENNPIYKQKRFNPI